MTDFLLLMKCGGILKIPIPLRFPAVLHVLKIYGGKIPHDIYFLLSENRIKLEPTSEKFIARYHSGKIQTGRKLKSVETGKIPEKILFHEFFHFLEEKKGIHVWRMISETAAEIYAEACVRRSR